jgi:hypothetical protein
MILNYFFPQPVQPCRKVRKNKAASAAGLFKFDSSTCSPEGERYTARP